ncbi:MAG TPA: hypothetical protein VIJ59_04255 [Caulobacteraceae bacterium]
MNDVALGEASPLTPQSRAAPCRPNAPEPARPGQPPKLDFDA